MRFRSLRIPRLSTPQGKCIGSPPSKCRRILNTCSLGLGHGWLASADSYARARDTLLGSRVETRVWGAGQPLERLLGGQLVPHGQHADAIMYTSNVEVFVGNPWAGMVDGWRTDLCRAPGLASLDRVVFQKYFSPRDARSNSFVLPPVTSIERTACDAGATRQQQQKQQKQHSESMASAKGITTPTHSATGFATGFAKCPLQSCSGAHKCAWQALSTQIGVNHANRTHAMLEVTREGYFMELEALLKANYAKAHIHDFLSKNASRLPSLWTQQRPKPSVFFHIITGEGGSRASLEAAVSAAGKAHAHEIWVMDHNRDASSFADPKRWPAAEGVTITGTHGSREAGSDLWKHDELAKMLERTVRSSCPHPKPLTDCAVMATRGPMASEKRNMIFGWSCAHPRIDADSNALDALKRSAPRAPSARSPCSSSGSAEHENAGCHRKALLRAILNTTDLPNREPDYVIPPSTNASAGLGAVPPSQLVWTIRSACPCPR